MFLSTLYSHLKDNVVLLKVIENLAGITRLEDHCLMPDYNLCFTINVLRSPNMFKPSQICPDYFYPAKYSPKYDIVESFLIELEIIVQL